MQSKCWASQRKSVKYNQKVMISNEGVEYAACYSCPAGRNGGLCQHVFALLLVLEKYCLKMTEISNELPGPQSCTSVKQTWGPRKRDVDPKPIMQTTVERAKGETERITYSSTFWEQYMLPTLLSFYYNDITYMP